jgi:hypothetical protein
MPAVITTAVCASNEIFIGASRHFLLVEQLFLRFVLSAGFYFLRWLTSGKKYMDQDMDSH